MNKEETAALIESFKAKHMIDLGRPDGSLEIERLDPILIGNVLEKIENTRIDFPKPVVEACTEMQNELVELWSNCATLKNRSLTKSLQEIVEKSGWEMNETQFAEDLKNKDKGVLPQQLKEPARALIEFLLEIFK